MINYEMDDTRHNFQLRVEAIQYFRSLIAYRQREGKATKVVNFAGHVGRHMRKEVRQWFINQYPNTADYVTFFMQNEHDFDYNEVTGEVKLASDNSKFKKPTHLTQLENKAREESTTLSEISLIVHEFQCFHKSFNLLKDSASQNEDSVSVQQLLESVEKIESNGMALKAIDKLLEKEKKIHGNRLAHYLIEYYSTIFVCNDRCAETISLTTATIGQLMKATKQIDDTIYVLLRPLLIKFLLKYGPKDVDELQHCISIRHNYIMEYLFRDSNDYSLFDFVLSNSDDFTYERVINDDNTASRMIIPKASAELNRLNNSNLNNSHSSQSFMDLPKASAELNLSNNSNHNNSHSSRSFMADNNSSPLADITPQFIDDASIDDNLNELVIDDGIANVSQQNGYGNHCCVCQMDGDSQLSSKLMDYSEFRQFVTTHTLCFMRRLIVDLKFEAEKRNKKSNCLNKASQTISTGNVVSRIF